MVCFATVLEDGLRFLDIAEGFLLLVALEKAESEVVVSLGCFLVIGSTDFKDVHQGALREGDCVLELGAG